MKQYRGTSGATGGGQNSIHACPAPASRTSDDGRLGPVAGRAAGRPFLHPQPRGDLEKATRVLQHSRAAGTPKGGPHSGLLRSCRLLAWQETWALQANSARAGNAPQSTLALVYRTAPHPRSLRNRRLATIAGNTSPACDLRTRRESPYFLLPLVLYTASDLRQQVAGAYSTCCPPLWPPHLY